MAVITSFLAKNGSPVTRADSAFLHSRFDPEKEAALFLDNTLDSRANIGCVLLVCPCSSFLVNEARRRLPGSRIVSIQACSDFAAHELYRADATVYADRCDDLERALDSALGPEAEFGVARIAWPPGANLLSREEIRMIEECVARINASAYTTSRFGRRWIRNAVANGESTDARCAISRGDSPILVACPGPSLESFLDLLKPSTRRPPFIIAVSSALPALLARDMVPDLVVTTDAGAWSRYHVLEARYRRIAIACPITSYPFAEVPRLWIDQRSPVEGYFAELLEKAIPIPENGTASGTALMLALAASSGPVIAAGLDLASMGMRSHSRPHGFDWWSCLSDGRLSPRHSAEWVSRAGDRPVDSTWKAPGSFDRYASWFSWASRNLPAHRISRVSLSPVEIRGMRRIATEEALCMILDDRDSTPPRLGSAIPISRPGLATRAVESMRAAALEWCESTTGPGGFLCAMIDQRATRIRRFSGEAEGLRRSIRSFFGSLRQEAGDAR